MLDGAQATGYATALATLVGVYITLRAQRRQSEPPEVRAIRRALAACGRRERRAALDMDRARAALAVEQREKARLREMLADSVIPAGHPGVPTSQQPAQQPATRPSRPSAPPTTPAGGILGP